MRLKTLLGLLLIATLIGCSNGSSGISTKDMSIVKVGDKKAKVEYGMDRSDAEKVLGKGAKKDGFGNYYTYGSGVTIMYRDDKVVGITISEGSADIYETNNGAKVGMLKDEIKKKYGKDYWAEYPNSLDYVYDTINKKYLKDSNASTTSTKDEKEKTYVISAAFDDNGYASWIMLYDRQAAMTGM